MGNTQSKFTKTLTCIQSQSTLDVVSSSHKRKLDEMLLSEEEVLQMTEPIPQGIATDTTDYTPGDFYDNIGDEVDIQFKCIPYDIDAPSPFCSYSDDNYGLTSSSDENDNMD